jgi:hypothetical protein
MTMLKVAQPAPTKIKSYDPCPQKGNLDSGIFLY